MAWKSSHYYLLFPACAGMLNFSWWQPADSSEWYLLNKDYDCSIHLAQGRYRVAFLKSSSMAIVCQDACRHLGNGAFLQYTLLYRFLPSLFGTAVGCLTGYSWCQTYTSFLGDSEGWWAQQKWLMGISLCPWYTQVVESQETVKRPISWGRYLHSPSPQDVAVVYQFFGSCAYPRNLSCYEDL